MRLRYKIALFMTALQTLLLAVVMVQTVRSETDNTYAAMSAYGRMMAKVIASRLISGFVTGEASGTGDLDSFINVVMSFDDRIACVAVSDSSRKVIAGDISSRWVEYEGAKEEALARMLDSEATYRKFKSVALEMESEGSHLGTVRIIFSLSALKKQILLSALTWLAIGFALTGLGIAGAFIISKKVTDPIIGVAGAMKRVESGDLDQKVEIRTRDEVGEMAHAFNRMAEGLREREFIKSTFSKYVSSQVAERILREKDFLKLKGEKRVVTVLFADIRGFTPLAESLPPEQVLDILNQYFSKMVDIVFRFGGLLNKFIGDAIMVLYNAPLDQKYHELRAILTGMEMQKEIGRINEGRRQRGEVQINMGIGINTGIAVAGNVGSELRLEYTVIGAGVNLAQRIESHTAKGQLLISESTYNAVRDYVEVLQLEPVQVKGVAEPVRLYAVINAIIPEDLNETL